MRSFALLLREQTVLEAIIVGCGLSYGMSGSTFQSHPKTICSWNVRSLHLHLVLLLCRHKHAYMLDLTHWFEYGRLA